MVAFKSRFWTAFDLPVRLEENACFAGAGCFEGVPYFEAAACSETAFDADVSEADAVVDADLAVPSACAEAAEPHAATLTPIRHASEAATDRIESGRDDAASDPRPRTAREREAEPDTPKPDTSEPETVRPSAPDVFPDWIPSPTASRDSPRRNLIVVFSKLLMPPVSRDSGSNDIPLSGQYTSGAIPTSTLKIPIPVGIFSQHSPI